MKEDKKENKINYGKVLEKTLGEIAACGRKPRLLLHVCCAPCSSYVLEYLNGYFDITVFFYNPNITVEEEYEKRKSELIRFINEAPFCTDVHFAETEYEPEKFIEMSKGLESEPERGIRCDKCYRLRLEKTAEYAARNGFDYFTTTLSISPLKNAQKLNMIGKSLSEDYRVSYLYSDFKKNEGYKRSIELSNEYSLYRQDFCGCEYSRRK